MLKKLLCGATLLCAATIAQAGVIEQEFNVEVQDTDFDTTITFMKFDDMDGARKLTSVMFSIDGSVFGSAEVESRDASAQVIETTLSAELTLTNGMNTLVVTIPSITNTFNATAFDGVNDAGGTSGITYPDLEANQFEMETYTDAMTLATFTGVGTIDTDFDAQATSRAIGAGNITTTFFSQAGGLVKVKYTYENMEVSAPSQVAFLGLGLLAFAGMRKIRK
jgi:hypothetical protein